MPVKTFTFAFKMDAKDLISYIVDRNLAIDIHATGTKRVEPIVNPSTELPPSPDTYALPPPAKKPEYNSRDVVLLFMNRHEKCSPGDIRAILEQSGYSSKSTSSLIHTLYQGGFIKKSGRGYYRITVKGQQRVVEAE